LAALTTSRAREFWLRWRRLSETQEDWRLKYSELE